MFKKKKMMYSHTRTYIEYDIISLSDPTFNLAKKGNPVIKKLGPSCEGLDFRCMLFQSTRFKSVNNSLMLHPAEKLMI